MVPEPPVGASAGNRRGRPFDPASIDRFFEWSLWTMLASGYCAMAGSGALDFPSLFSGAAALAARALLQAGVLRFEIPPRWVSLATLLYILFYPLDYWFISRNFLLATVHLVFFVAIVKLLTARTRRDFLLLGIIAFLELLAASILSSNLSFFVFLTLFVAASVATFASAEIRRSARGRAVVTRGVSSFGRRLAWLTVFSCGGIFVLTAGLFIVLPRTARAAFERFVSPAQRVAGFANEVSLGEGGSIRRGGAAMMHVRFQDNFQPAGLKWRGNALAEFNGTRWYNTPAKMHLRRPADGLLKIAGDDQLRRAGPRATYEVLLHGPSDTLFVAGLAEHIRLPAALLLESPSGAFKLPFGAAENFRYVVYAWLGGADGAAPLSEDERNFHLRLPPVDRRVISLARSLTAGLASDAARAQALERYLRTQFTYSLEISGGAEDPLAHFLFESRQGYCEYFASALAVMLRVVWIPARVVTGFQGGTANPLTGWHVVRSSDAHAWVEAWIPGQGWTVYDPTPPDPDPPGLGLAGRLLMYRDALQVFWQEWVIGYDLDRQLTLAFRVDQSRRRLSFRWFERQWESLLRVFKEPPDSAPFILVLAAALAAASPWLFRRVRGTFRARRARSPGMSRSAHEAAVLYRRMLARLERRGLAKPSALTPSEFLRTLPGGEVRDAVRAFTAAYERVRYGGDSEAVAALNPLLARIELLK
jgi:transglutaminase-like putative cysteine protease